jgi:hypothetical protein
MNTQDREMMYLYLSSMLIIIPTGFGIWTLFGMLPAISAMFVVGGFLIYLRTIMTIKFAELEIHLKPVLEGME